MQAHEIWRRLKDDDYFWYNSDSILEKSQVDETKVFILVILEDAIKVPPIQCSKSGWPCLKSKGTP